MTKPEGYCPADTCANCKHVICDVSQIDGSRFYCSFEASKRPESSAPFPVLYDWNRAHAVKCNMICHMWESSC